MNRNVAARPATPRLAVRTVPLRSANPRFQPKKKGIVGRIFRWLVFLGIVGAIAASFFVDAGNGKTYADLYTIPAYKWAKDKAFPPESETEAKKDAAPAVPSEL